MADEKNAPLASIWQSALGQIDEIRDVIVRGSQAGKAKIDVQLLRRSREKVLAQIGEALLDDVKRGAATLPAAAEEMKKKVDEIDQQIEAAEAEAQKVFRAK
jgi:seryl-tRNA synthetase